MLKLKEGLGRKARVEVTGLTFFVAYAVTIPAIYMNIHHSKAPLISKKIDKVRKNCNGIRNTLVCLLSSTI